MSEIQLLVDAVQNNPLASELAKCGLSFVTRIAGGALASRFSKSNGNAEKNEREIARVSETLEEFREDVATRFRASSWQSRIAEHEAQEPSTESFIERAMNLSIDARVESKRRFIGRLIACRLQIDDSDEAETVASTALEIVGACSERQLLAIAAIRLTKDLGKPERTLTNLDDAEAWLDAKHGSRVRAILNGPGWDDRRLEGLGRVGAITMALHRSGTFLSGQHADDVDQWIALQNLSQLEQLRDDAGSEAWSADMRARFPVTSGLHSLSSGTAFSSNDRFVPYRLDELHLTQAGNLLEMRSSKRSRGKVRAPRSDRTHRIEIPVDPAKRSSTRLRGLNGPRPPCDSASRAHRRRASDGYGMATARDPSHTVVKTSKEKNRERRLTPARHPVCSDDDAAAKLACSRRRLAQPQQRRDDHSISQTAASSKSCVWWAS